MLVFLSCWFIRRLSDALVPNVIMVRHGLSNLTLTYTARCRPAPVRRLRARRWRLFAMRACCPLCRPSAVLRARRRPSAPPILANSRACRGTPSPRVCPCRQFRPCAATRARRQSTRAAQGPCLPPQLLPAANLCDVVRHPLSPPILASDVPVHLQFGGDYATVHAFRVKVDDSWYLSLNFCLDSKNAMLLHAH
jgi:hypothetical protein